MLIVELAVSSGRKTFSMTHHVHIRNKDEDDDADRRRWKRKLVKRERESCDESFS